VTLLLNSKVLKRASNTYNPLTRKKKPGSIERPMKLSSMRRRKTHGPTSSKYGIGSKLRRLPVSNTTSGSVRRVIGPSVAFRK